MSLDAWTFQAWPKANILTPADGDEVRLAFQARLGRLQTIPDEDLSGRRQRKARSGERRITAMSRRQRETADGETNPVSRHTDMTLLRQIESNRRNAQRNTGPKTQSGKQRSKMPFAMD